MFGKIKRWEPPRCGPNDAREAVHPPLGNHPPHSPQPRGPSPLADAYATLRLTVTLQENMENM